MLKFLYDMKIRNKIIILLLIPVLGLVYFSAHNVLDSSRVVSESELFQSFIKLSVDMSNLVHEQQKERGATAVYVGSEGKKFKNELADQRKSTDEKRQIFLKNLAVFDKDRFDDVFNSKLQDVLDNLKKIDDIRNSVDNLAITAADAIGFYTKQNARNFNLIFYASTIITDAKLVNAINGYVNYLQGKERAGIERAVGANGFASGSFTPEAMNKFKALIAAQDTYGNIFLSYATDAQKEVYQKAMEDESSVEVRRMRDIAINNPLVIGEITGKHWFDTITKKINILKETENILAQDLIDLAERNHGAAESERKDTILITMVVLILTLLTSIFFSAMITNPITSLTQVMNKIAANDIEVAIPYTEQKDEIGAMAGSVQIFKENAIERQRLEAEQKEAELRAEEDKKKMMNELADNFESRVQGIIDSVAAAATELNHTAESMQNLSTTANNISTEAASSSQETANNVSTVASAAEEMSASINEISQQVSNANKAAGDAAGKANNAGEITQSLQDATSRIGEIVGLIRDIAEQINLLALNATIESARAGDAGKGFAVVATEVKNLAEQTAKATEEISKQISSVQDVAKDVVDVVEVIKNSISSVSEYANGIASAVEEQTAVTNEIAASMSTASNGVNSVNKGLEGVQTASSDTLVSAGELLDATSDLSKQAEGLSHEVSQFLSEIRAS